MTITGRSGSGPPVVDYRSMSSDELVDHFIDENGLAAYLDLQQRGISHSDWDWRIIARDLAAFTHGYLTFSPEYLAGLYEMQLERIAEEAAA